LSGLIAGQHSFKIRTLVWRQPMLEIRDKLFLS
jgi:hypothetical protein